MKPVLLALMLLSASTCWAQTSASAPASRHEETIDDRVKELHSELKITPAEEEKWGKVADAMRENAKTIDGLLEQRHASAPKATAVENMESWNAIAQAHAEGSKALLDAFESLYADMPDAQKNLADTAFRPAEGHAK